MKVRLLADHVFSGAVVPKGTLLGGEGQPIPEDFAVSTQMEPLDDEAKKAMTEREEARKSPKGEDDSEARVAPGTSRQPAPAGPKDASMPKVGQSGPADQGNSFPGAKAPGPGGPKLPLTQHVDHRNPATPPPKVK